MIKKLLQYAVWDDSSSDPGEHFWMSYDSLEDAVASNDGGAVEVYKAEYEPMGVFEMAPKKVVKVKKAKGSK